jgi:hypothetical protein
VVEEPLYLQDEEGAMEENVNLLPVCVLEILSEEAGFVQRNYRIQISANNGEKLGDVDIIDDNDLKMVIGVEKMHLLHCDPDERDMNQIFKYIIENRILLNLANADKKVKQGGRREGVRVGGMSSGPGSMIVLQRDTPDMFPDSTGSTDTSSGVPGGRVDRGKYWVRLISKRHRTSGRAFRTVALFECDDEMLSRRTNDFFSSAPLSKRFEQIDVVFNTQDLNSRETTILRVSGQDIWEWLPRDPLDLAHIVRRQRFGKWLIEQIRIQYSALGAYHLQLHGMDREFTRQQEVVTYFSHKLQRRLNL